MLFMMATQGHAKDVMDTLVTRANEFGPSLRSDLDDVTLGKSNGGGAAVPAITPSRVSMLDAAPAGAASSQDASSAAPSFDSGDFQKMLQQFQKIQEKEQKAEGHLQKKVEELQ